MTELGKLLQQTRKKKKYSLEQVNKLTRISQRYIKALEESDSSVFPAEVYHRSFLKNYAKFLGLDLDEVIKMYEQEKNGIQYDLFSDEEISNQTLESKNTKRNKEKKQNSSEQITAEVKGKEENKIKKSINVVFKKVNKKENTKINAKYENNNEEKVKIKNKKTEEKALFITKLILVIILCILFVGLLIIIKVSFSKEKSTQIKEETEIVSVDNIPNDNEKIFIEEKKEVTKQVLEIDAIKDCWIRVFCDGNQIFEGVLLSGQQQTCFADDNFTVKIGNTDNLKLSFNNKPVDISAGEKNDKTNTLTFKKDN